MAPAPFLDRLIADIRDLDLGDIAGSGNQLILHSRRLFLSSAKPDSGIRDPVMVSHLICRSSANSATTVSSKGIYIRSRFFSSLAATSELMPFPDNLHRPS